MVEEVKRIRVLVVDDSFFMQKAISRILNEADGFSVVGTAKNGEEALDKAVVFKPDVMTLDIDMPGMSGLVVLERLMSSSPLPVVVVSSLSQIGAGVTVQALELGAVDFLPKQLDPSESFSGSFRDQLIEKVRIAAQAVGKLALTRRPSVAPCPKPARQMFGVDAQAGSLSSPQCLVVIGSSTGGPQALQELLPSFPATFPAGIVIAQHMPKFFTKSFADRLNQICQLTVREAEQNDMVKPGVALIAPGGQHLRLESRGTQGMVIQLSDHPHELHHRPSVDVMMTSAAQVNGKNVVGVILTGMGQDGVMGMQSIKQAGGVTLAQDESSCLIYGMPKAVVDGGCAHHVIPLSRMADEIRGQVECRVNVMAT